MKSKLFALLLLLPLLARTTDVGTSGSERMLNQHGGKTKSVNRDQLKRDTDETMLIIEDIARQMKLAPKDEIEDVWASGVRDYHLAKGLVRDARKACEDTYVSISENDGLKAAKLREQARDTMRPHHKGQSEDYVRDMRNWLSISEGTLRRANEKRERDAKKK